METKFNFKSAICTSREQSERLLSLGIKKETADMVHYMNGWGTLATPWRDDYEGYKCYYPAWSLHRLLMMATDKRKVMLIRCESDLYDVVIKKIECEIKEEIFNKEYLERKE